MATFYKYQERDLDSQVNYADIGLGISNLVTDQLATRKAKKEAYDDQVRAFNQYLDEHPTGEEENMTEWTASYASQMQQKMLANQRAFKNGRVSERDNVVFMQNVQNGTKTMFDLSADYQAEYKDKMERMNAIDPANRSQLAETWMIEQFESFSNFKQTKPIINDKTGLLLLSKKNENGTFDTVSAADMATRIKAKYNYFDIDKATTDSEAIMGRFVTAAVEERAARGKQGMTSEEENKLNIQNKEKFDTGLKTQTAVFLSIPNNTMSVLTNSIGGYTHTFSREEAEKDPMKILMVKKEGSTGLPQPDFTTYNGKKQQEAANKMFEDMLKSKVDYERKVEVTSQIPDYQRFASDGSGDDENKTETAAGAWNQLRYGTTKEAKASAADILLGTPIAIEAGLLAIDLESSPGVVKLKYTDSQKNRSIPMYNTTAIDWARTGVELHGEADINKAMIAGGGGADTPYGSLGKKAAFWTGTSSYRKGGAPKKNNAATSGGNARD